MFRKFCWILGVIVFFTNKSVATVQITEIQPFTMEEEAEWFEFMIESGSLIDITHWKVSNGKTKKEIGLVQDKLIYDLSGKFSGSGSVRDSLIFLPNQQHYFSWEKAPISLSNSGGLVQILNEKNEILSEVFYPKGKYGKRKNYKYSEVFNWDFLTKKLYPLIFRKNYGEKFRHTKGFENKKSPTFPEDMVILISEVSVDRDKEKGGDFIEIYFVSGPSKINLKYAEIKYNGTSLYFFEDDFWVSPKQFLTIEVGKSFSGIVKNTAPYEIYSDKKESLSKGSGSVELILFSDTSFKKTEDFVCYMNEKLSETERKRVEKNKENWEGRCIDISSLIPNQSIARGISWSDSNRFSDFFSHFNGTQGRSNILENKNPVAVITVQGSGKTIGIVPFSVNLTGENSSDPDGQKDLKEFIWKLDGKIFSKEKNPKSFKLEELGEYEISLEIIDFSGDSDQVLQIFSVVSTGSVQTGHQSKGGMAFIEELLSPKIKKGQKDKPDDFFADFLAQAPDSFWKKALAPPKPVSSFDPRGDEIVKMIDNREEKKAECRKKWIAKNIGWAFVEEI